MKDCINNSMFMFSKINNAGAFFIFINKGHMCWQFFVNVTLKAKLFMV